MREESRREEREREREGGEKEREEGQRGREGDRDNHTETLYFVFYYFRSFVIEKQPPQVIKTSNRFSASVRLGLPSL